MAAKNKEAVIERLSDEELADIAGPDSNDLTRTGRNLTEVVSETKVVDYTEVAPAAPAMEVEVVEEELDGGTLMRTYLAVTPAKTEDE